MKNFLKSKAMDGELVFFAGGTHCRIVEGCTFGRITDLPYYYIGKYPVTQRLWQAVMGTNPSYFKGEQRPVENISWVDAQEFMERLLDYYDTNSTVKSMGWHFSLPTEAQWQHAAILGTQVPSQEKNAFDLVAWHEDNSNDETHDVGLLQPNDVGIYDMYGNVWEMCNDQALRIDALQEGRNEPYIVVQGGSYRSVKYFYDKRKTYYREKDSVCADQGFRVALCIW